MEGGLLAKALRTKLKHIDVDEEEANVKNKLSWGKYTAAFVT